MFKKQKKKKKPASYEIPREIMTISSICHLVITNSYNKINGILQN